MISGNNSASYFEKFIESAKANNLPLTFAVNLYSRRNGLERLETGNNIISCSLSILFKQHALFQLVNTTQEIKSYKMWIAFLSIPTALYILGKNIDRGNIKVPPQIKPILVKIGPFLETANKVASFAVYIALFNSGLYVAPAVGITLMSARIIRNNTDYISDKVQKCINTYLPIIVTFSLFFNYGTRDKIWLIVSTMMFSKTPFFSEKLTKFLIGTAQYPINLSLRHQKDPVDIKKFIENPNSPLIIDTSHYNAIPQSSSIYSRIKYRPMDELIAEVDQFTKDFNSKLGEDFYFKKMLELYKQREHLQQIDREKIELLEDAWRGGLSNNELINREKKLIHLTDDMTAQLTEWRATLSIGKEQIEMLPDNMKKRISIKKEKARAGLDAYEKKIKDTKILINIKQIKNNMGERKAPYRDYFPEKLKVFLLQLKSGAFHQGGTVDIDLLRRQTTFIFDQIKKDLASDSIHQENALANFTQLTERCMFCDSGVSEAIATLSIQMDTPITKVGSSIKNQIYQLLRDHREEQSKFKNQDILSKSEAFYKLPTDSLSKDVHRIKISMAYDNTSMHFSPNSRIAREPLVSYFILWLRKHILASKHYPLENAFFNPNDIIKKIFDGAKESNEFKEKIKQWQRAFLNDIKGWDPDLVDKFKNISDLSLLKLFLMDIGVLKLDPHPELQQAFDRPEWMNSIVRIIPQTGSILNRIRPPVARSG
jgi:hypothetical protein